MKAAELLDVLESVRLDMDDQKFADLEVLIRDFDCRTERPGVAFCSTAEVEDVDTGTKKEPRTMRAIVIR